MRTVQSWTCELGYGADTMFHRTYFLLLLLLLLLLSSLSLLLLLLLSRSARSASSALTGSEWACQWERANRCPSTDRQNYLQVIASATLQMCKFWCKSVPRYVELNYAVFGSPCTQMTIQSSENFPNSQVHCNENEWALGVRFCVQ